MAGEGESDPGIIGYAGGRGVGQSREGASEGVLIGGAISTSL